MNKDIDYIIVGAGSAGCVLANRLSESGEYQVVLLVTGGSDKNIMIQMPTALSYPMNTEKYAWQFHTEPEPYLDNRKMHCPRGKVMGEIDKFEEGVLTCEIPLEKVEKYRDARPVLRDSMNRD